MNSIPTTPVSTSENSNASSKEPADFLNLEHAVARHEDRSIVSARLGLLSMIVSTYVTVPAYAAVFFWCAWALLGTALYFHIRSENDESVLEEITTRGTTDIGSNPS